MLIKCPECHQEVSDKARQCIHCGFPLSTTTHKAHSDANNVTYSLRVTSIENAAAVALNVQTICDITALSVDQLKHILNNLPANLTSGQTFEEAANMKQRLFKMGLSLVLLPSSASFHNVQHQPNNIPPRNDDTTAVTCPRCGSTQITTGQRGYKLLTGFLGSSKTVNRCANCGYKWEPSYWTRNR